jgi:transposase-like protein
MRDCYIGLIKEVIKKAVQDLKLIATTDEKKQIIAEYQKLGTYGQVAEKFGMSKNAIRKIIADNRIGQDAYKFLTGEGVEVWAELAGLNGKYIREKIAKYSDLSQKQAFTPNIVE